MTQPTVSSTEGQQFVSPPGKVHQAKHGTRRSPRAAERRAERVATVVTGTHSSFIYDGAGPFIAL